MFSLLASATIKQGDLVVQTAGTHSGVSGSTDLVKVGIVDAKTDSLI